MQDSYRDNKEWQSKTLELGVIGAIGTGVGATFLRGNASSATKGAANTAKRLAKNVDRYMDKTVFKKNPIGKFVYRTLKNVPKQSDLIKRDGEGAIEELKYDMKAIRRHTQQAKQDAALKEVADAYLQGRPQVSPDQLFDEKAHIIKLKSEAGDQWRRGLKSDMLAGTTPPSNPLPQPTKNKKLLSEAVGASVTGLAFGAGLTGFHAVDRRLTGEDKKKERSFNAAGSYLGGKTMEKKATGGATQAYKNIATFGNKIPLAVANGIGFTGVTIGTASLLEKVRAEARQKAGAEPMQPQVVIVENGGGKKNKNKTLEQAHFLSSSHPANYMMQQNAAEVDDSLDKTATFRDIGTRLQESFSGIPQKARNFAQDFAGHTEERKRLMDRIEGRTVNYETEAARIATPGDIADASKDYEKFYSPEKAKELSLAHLARNMKMQDQAAHDALYEQMASARLKGLGVASTGAGLAFLARPKKEDQQP